MSERLYETMEIVDLKDMLNKTKNLYFDKPAYKIKVGEGQYKIFTHKEVREMVDGLGTSLIDIGLKDKRIAVIGENRYEWEIAYLAIVCGTGMVVPLDKSLPENELESLIERSEVEAIFYSSRYEEVLNKIKYNENNKLKHLISMDAVQNEKGIYSEKELIENGKKLIEERIFMMIRKKIEKQGKLDEILEKEEKYKNCTMQERKEVFKEIHDMIGGKVKLFISGAAALETSVRYLAENMGKEGIRVNAISAGPIKTLSAKGIKDFNSILSVVEEKAPLHRNVTIEQVGNVATFLLSEMSDSITGQVIYADSGYNIMGV